MIQAYTLFSGSSGNSIYIRDEKTEILIDAGRSCSLIQGALLELGTCLQNISAIFVTHEHSDHIKGLEIISKKFKIPVHMTYPSYAGGVSRGTFLDECTTPHDVIYEVKCGTLCVKSFPIPHDSEQNVGYLIESKGEVFGIATDIGHLTTTIVDSLVKCERIIVESNHDIKMLKSGPYPSFLKQRILSSLGHLSNVDCAKLCVYLCQNGVKGITLAHLSKENNTPALAFDEVRRALDSNNLENIPIRVAMPENTVCATE